MRSADSEVCRQGVADVAAWGQEVFAWGSNQYGQCGAVERARGHTAAERETAAEARRAAAERERATEAPPSEGDDEDAGWRGYGLGCYYTRPILQSVGTAVSASHPHGADQAPLRAEQASHHGSDQHRSRRRSDHHHQGSDQVCDLRCGGAHSLILLRGGGILALGRGEYGVLGNGELRDAVVPTLVRGFGPRTGFGRNCRERADELDREAGSAETQVKRQRGWASSSKGSQGDRRAEEWWEEVEGDVVAVAVAAGAEHSLAVDSKGRVWGWGWNAHGQLGVGVQGSAREGDGGVVARPCRVDVPKVRRMCLGSGGSGVGVEGVGVMDVCSRSWSRNVAVSRARSTPTDTGRHTLTWHVGCAGTRRRGRTCALWSDLCGWVVVHVWERRAAGHGCWQARTPWLPVTRRCPR